MIIKLLPNRGVSIVIYCPLCSGTTVGKIGTSQYYCWNCYYEFNVKQEKVVVYDVAEDGSLTDVTAQVLV